MAIFGRESLLGRTGRVVETEMVARQMKRVRLAGKEFRHLNWKPGQQIRLKVDSFTKLHDAVRTYSIWRYEPDEGIIDLLMYMHGEGPGSAWVEKVKTGDVATFVGPTGKFVLDETAPYYLFAAEETGAVAVQAICQKLPATARALGVLEADTAGDEIPPLPGRVFPWVYRNGKPASPTSGLVDAVKRLELPAEPGLAYIAGETQSCVAIRNYLLNEKGWPKKNIQTKPFWEAGKTGLE